MRRSRAEELYRMLVDGHRVDVDAPAAAARAAVHLLAGRVRFADGVLKGVAAAEVGRERLQRLGGTEERSLRAVERLLGAILLGRL